MDTRSRERQSQATGSSSAPDPSAVRPSAVAPSTGASSESEPDWPSFWVLDPRVTFLNHGSFGACPRVVLELQQELRWRIEREPIQFFQRDLEPILDDARSILASFLGTSPEALAFVPNATTGVNTVLRSLRFERGDELLTTNHRYNACRNTLDLVAESSGARVVEVPIPVPLDDPGKVVEALMKGVNERTRLALLDHVTSPTGMVFPVEALVSALREKGVLTLVDGAHAPGMIPLHLESLGADFYTGNCHKWLCAPKGAAFLYVDPKRRTEVRPLTISHGANATRTDRSRFHLEFDWVGTSDPTPYLCVPASLRFMSELVSGGWPEVMRRNRALALEARALLNGALGAQPLCPDSMIGSLAAVTIPDGAPVALSSGLAGDPLHTALFEKYGIEVPIAAWPAPPRRVLRVSAQLYNSRRHYEYLSTALGELLASAAQV